MQSQTPIIISCISRACWRCTVTHTASSCGSSDWLLTEPSSVWSDAAGAAAAITDPWHQPELRQPHGDGRWAGSQSSTTGVGDLHSPVTPAVKVGAPGNHYHLSRFKPSKDQGPPPWSAPPPDASVHTSPDQVTIESRSGPPSASHLHPRQATRRPRPDRRQAGRVHMPLHATFRHSLAPSASRRCSNPPMTAPVILPWMEWPSSQALGQLHRQYMTVAAQRLKHSIGMGWQEIYSGGDNGIWRGQVNPSTPEKIGKAGRQTGT
jgi:hypothetical protein